MKSLAFLTLLVSVWASPILRAVEELAAQNGTQADDFLVKSLPGLEAIPEYQVPLMHAGQLELYKENNTHFFFWKFADKDKAEDAQKKTIFWLNGGPGCSSMDGALMEAGPFRVNKHKKVEYNEGSWHRKGDIVFVDQPAGTGFSYGTDYDSELADVSWHFLRFLEKYFEVFPEEVDNDILLAGESYAGQYIPYIASALHERNQNLKKKSELELRDSKNSKQESEEDSDSDSDSEESDKSDKADSDKSEKADSDKSDVSSAVWNLAGLLIGNGYISPIEQGLSYIPYAMKNKIVDQTHPRWSELLRAHERCQQATDRARAEDSLDAYRKVNHVCDSVLTTLLSVTRDSSAARNQQCYNMYDYTLKDSYPSCGMNWPPDLANVQPFLREEEIMDDLNLVQHKKWSECSGPVGSHMRARQSMPAVKLLPELLKHYPVVLFHGNRDIICNYVGAEDMIKRLDWNGARGFSDNAPKYDWVHAGQTEGYLQAERNLTYVNVFNSSHMVPFDKPDASRALVDLLYRRYETKDGEIITSAVAAQAPKKPEKPDNSDSSGSSDSNKSSESHETHNSSRALRVVQLIVVLVLIWGVCLLISTYWSKPTSIIKTKSTGRKKNVQWADQLEIEGFAEGPKSMFSKAMSKLKPDRGFVPVSQDDHDVSQDIELEEGLKPDTSPERQ